MAILFGAFVFLLVAWIEERHSIRQNLRLARRMIQQDPELADALVEAIGELPAGERWRLLHLQTNDPARLSNAYRVVDDLLLRRRISDDQAERALTALRIACGSYRGGLP